MAVVGTCTTTYKKKLLCRHPEWLAATKTLFNEVLNFYYGLLNRYPDFALLSSQPALRELEKLTIRGRDRAEPAHPLPFDRLPVYFRRAAINGAIALMHSYLEKHKNWEMGQKPYKTEPMPAGEISASPVFYKGMYKEFLQDSILLKVYTGTSWCWIKCRLKGRILPEQEISQWLSPAVILGKKYPMLHVPVKTLVADARSGKERMDARERVMGIAFSNEDALAVCAVYEADGRYVGSRFIRGGKAYRHHSKRLMERIRENRKVMGKKFDWSGANKKHWEHQKRLREYYAHKVSREIVSYCKETGVKVIAVTKTENDMPLYVKKKLGDGSPYLLRKLIMEKLSYKVWKEGLVITGVRPHYTAGKCSICRSYLEKEERDGREFRCKEGHRGNRDLNTAKNIGKMSLKKFGKKLIEESMQTPSA